MAAWAVLEADALTLFRRWTRWLLFVAERDKELEWERLEEETLEKLPETGRERACSCHQQSTLVLSKQPISGLVLWMKP